MEVEERRRLRLEKKARKEREALEAKGRRKKGEQSRLEGHGYDPQKLTRLALSSQINHWTSIVNVV